MKTTHLHINAEYNLKFTAFTVTLTFDEDSDVLGDTLSF